MANFARLFRSRRFRLVIVNAITGYRLAMAPVLVVIVYTSNPVLFGWLLGVSFFTDLIDGTIARKWNVTSIAGSRLDSIADDLTILAGIIGVFALKPAFIRENVVLVVIMIALLAIQNAAALIRYRQMSSFHTYSAKVAAILQGTFLILLFLLPEPLYALFLAAAIATIVDLVEEIILVFLLKKWQSDVKGLYWVLRTKRVAAVS